MSEDPTDIFDSSLSSLFSIAPIGFSPSSDDGYYTYHLPSPPSSSSPSSVSPLTPSIRSIRLKLPQPPPSLYTTLQAQLIWPSAIYLADLLSKEIIDVKGKRIVELGSAAGLPGIISSIQGCQHVVSTDYGVEEVLSVLKDNFSEATAHTQAHGQQTNNWKVLGHCWGDDVKPLLSASSPSPDPTIGSSILTNDRKDNGKFDVVLAADVLWTTSSHSLLLDSITALISEGGIAHITAGLHTGRGPIERFIASAEEKGFKVTSKGEVRLISDREWEEYNENMGKIGEEERGVVLWLTLESI
ncbi:uncharacterized protein IL334_005265 [Kwoniella shivajii]|uniref:Nicotinamide N-methyltransferase n=1 Tax=Kwoniella shivajii TaxID=564305 RepID=A0ABZ1D2N3_9TREE|nr:hypothetical protein IL334_005265 [Kwoniella shivajii]